MCPDEISRPFPFPFPFGSAGEVSAEKSTGEVLTSRKNIVSFPFMEGVSFEEEFCEFEALIGAGVPPLLDEKDHKRRSPMGPARRPGLGEVGM